jgi:hypothetical protein
MSDIGELTRDPKLIVQSLDGSVLMDESIDALLNSWLKPLDW